MSQLSTNDSSEQEQPSYEITHIVADVFGTPVVRLSNGEYQVYGPDEDDYEEWLRERYGD